MACANHEMIMLTTPRGHEVRAEIDYGCFELRRARVVNNYTGVIKTLDQHTAETLARALKARQVYEHAIAESRAAEDTLKRFGHLAAALGNAHPALEPYWQEAAAHKTIASDMRERASHFHEDAMAAIDRIAD